MTQPKRLDGALARLGAALDAFETIVAGRLENEASLADTEEELAIMHDDRGRLALELDEALARIGALEKAREEVLRRLENASVNVSAALGETSPGHAAAREDDRG